MENLKLVRLDTVLKGFVEEAYENLQASLDQNETSNNSSHPHKAILLALHEAKQKLFRLDIICQWGQKAKAAVQCKRVLDACRQDGDALIAAADQLAYLHSELLHTKTPIFDVPLSFRILGERNVNILPNKIWKEIMAHDPTSSKNLAYHPNKGYDDHGMKKRMLFILKSKLLREEIQEYPFLVDLDEDETSVILRSKESLYEARACLVPSPSPKVIVEKWRNIRDEECGEDRVMIDSIDSLKDIQLDDFYSWRWQVFKVALLPHLESSVSHISASSVDFIRQAIDQKMWISSDFQMLEKLGLQDTLFPKRDMSAGIESPLLELDKILKPISGHILVGVILLDAARKLESGSWKGSIKVGKPAQANGIRIEIWCGLPTITSQELEQMEKSDYLDEGMDLEGGLDQAAFEMHFDSSSSLVPYIYPASDWDFSHVIQDLCKPDASGDGNLNQLLLKIASRLASSHLQAIMSSLKRQMQQHPNSLSQYSSLFYRVNGSSDRQSPRLDLITCNEGILSLSINLKTGHPLYMLGSSVLEDGVVYEPAYNLMQNASSRLANEMKQSKTSMTRVTMTRSMHFCSLVAKHTLNLWSELVSLTSLRHLLIQDPFTDLKRCHNVPGMILEADKYTVCYQVESSKVVELPKTLAIRAKQKYLDHLVGYLVFQGDLGNIGFQAVKFCIYQVSASSFITKERRIITGHSSWDKILGEQQERKNDLSGKKRSRSNTILSCPNLYSGLSKSMQENLSIMENAYLYVFAQEFMLLQFEELMIQADEIQTGDLKRIVYKLKMPQSIFLSKNALIPGDESCDITIEANQEFSVLAVSLMDSRELNMILRRTNLESSSLECTISDSSMVIKYDLRGKESNKGVWGALSSLLRVLECQRLASSLLCQSFQTENLVLMFPENLEVRFQSIKLDSLEFDITARKGMAGEFKYKAEISWNDAIIDINSWPEGDNSFVCSPKLHLSEKVPDEILECLNSELKQASSNSKVEASPRFISSLAHLSYLGHFLECSLLGSKVQSETPIKEGEVRVTKIEIQYLNGTNTPIICLEFTCSQKHTIACRCLLGTLGFKDFECYPGEQSSDVSWFLRAWEMWKMEHGWDVQMKGTGVFVPSGALLDLQKQLKEILFCCCGQR